MDLEAVLSCLMVLLHDGNLYFYDSGLIVA
jgi:hypothetical protein